MAALLTSLGISIHAPREGGDCIYRTQSPRQTISIHAPREGGDHIPGQVVCGFAQFQSTPPARGATCPQRHQVSHHHDFNPRPPRGGRPSAFAPGSPSILISIPAPRAGGDVDGLSIGQYLTISIHAPREGGDSKDAQFYL